jgi:glycosidase
MWRRNPVVYEINTRVWLRDLGQRLGRPADLGCVPEAEVDRLQEFGLDGVWLMGVWTPSPASRRIALRHAGLHGEFRRALPDLTDDDVLGSPFAVKDYRVSEAVGGDEGLRRFRRQLAARGLRLMLDFVPNHMAIDHEWTVSHPERFVRCIAGEDRSGMEGQWSEGSESCFAREVAGETKWLAHGRDPYFPPWTDTVQIDYRDAETRRCMVGELQSIAERCDGVRCDMAMLVTNKVFTRTWGRLAESGHPPEDEFWTDAISTIKNQFPEFIFLAEVYWDMEAELLQQGFDFAYDKSLYDMLLAANAEAVVHHLRQNSGLQSRLAQFVENHDERRAAEALPSRRLQTAALLVATLPGLRLFYEGQFDGRHVRLPVQLGRAPQEPPNPEIQTFYRRLLGTVSGDLFHDGQWRLLSPRPAWQGSDSYRSIVAYYWHAAGGEAALVAANLASRRAQARLPISFPGLSGGNWQLRELLDLDQKRPTIYQRDGSALVANGLFVDLEPNAYHFFALERAGGAGDPSAQVG